MANLFLNQDLDKTTFSIPPFIAPVTFTVISPNSTK